MWSAMLKPMVKGGGEIRKSIGWGEEALISQASNIGMHPTTFLVSHPLNPELGLQNCWHEFQKQ